MNSWWRSLLAASAGPGLGLVSWMKTRPPEQGQLPALWLPSPINHAQPAPLAMGSSCFLAAAMDMIARSSQTPQDRRCCSPAHHFGPEPQRRGMACSGAPQIWNQTIPVRWLPSPIHHAQPRPLGHRVHGLVQLLDPVPLLACLTGPAAVALDGEVHVGVAEPGGDHSEGDAALQAPHSEEVPLIPRSGCRPTCRRGMDFLRPPGRLAPATMPM